MPSIRQLMERFEVEAREAASRPPPPDPLAGHRDALGEMLARLDGLAAGHPPRMAKAKRNRLAFALDGARREVRRALDALGAGPGRG